MNNNITNAHYTTTQIKTRFINYNLTIYHNMDKKEQFSILTKKDVLILQKLLEDGRQSSASISKEIDLGREIINYRIKRLIKENLIVKFIPKINEDILNYKEYIILLKLNLDDEISKEKFIKQKIGNKYLIWFIKSQAGWDLVIRLYAENINEFKKKLAEILDSCSSVLTKYYTIISSQEINTDNQQKIHNDIFKNDCEFKKDFTIIKDNQNFELDEKNKEILNMLEENARIQYKEIGEKLNISSDTVKYRIEKMKSCGVIENFTPVLNYNKLGFMQFAGIIKFLYLNAGESEDISAFFKQSRSIINAIKNLNSQEYFITLIFEEKEEIEKFKEILNIKYGKKIESIELFKID